MLNNLPDKHIPDTDLAADKGDLGLSGARLPAARHKKLPAVMSEVTSQLNEKELNDLVDIAGVLIESSESNGTIGTINLAPFFRLVTTYAPELEPDCNKHKDEQHTLMEALFVVNDLLERIFLPHDRLVAINYFDGIEVIRGEIDRATWSRQTYLGKQLWTADINFTQASDMQMGICPGNLAFSDPNKSYEDSRKFFRTMTDWTEAGDAPELVVKVLRLFNYYKISQDHYAEICGTLRMRLHELQHAQDHIFTDIYRQKQGEHLSVTETLLAPESDLHGSLGNYKDDPITLSRADILIGEVSALIGGVQQELEHHHKNRKHKDLVVAFADMLLSLYQSTAVQDHDLVTGQFQAGTTASGVLLNLFQYETGIANAEHIIGHCLSQKDPALCMKNLVDTVSRKHFRGYIARAKIAGIPLKQKKTRKR